MAYEVLARKYEGKISLCHSVSVVWRIAYEVLARKYEGKISLCHSVSVVWRILVNVFED